MSGVGKIKYTLPQGSDLSSLAGAVAAEFNLKSNYRLATVSNGNYPTINVTGTVFTNYLSGGNGEIKYFLSDVITGGSINTNYATINNLYSFSCSGAKSYVDSMSASSIKSSNIYSNTISGTNLKADETETKKLIFTEATGTNLYLSGESSIYDINIRNDSTTLRDNFIGRDENVTRNLNVGGNLSVEGDIIIHEELVVVDPLFQIAFSGAPYSADEKVVGFFSQTQSGSSKTAMIRDPDTERWYLLNKTTSLSSTGNYGDFQCQNIYANVVTGTSADFDSIVCITGFFGILYNSFITGEQLFMTSINGENEKINNSSIVNLSGANLRSDNLVSMNISGTNINTHLITSDSSHFSNLCANASVISLISGTRICISNTITGQHANFDDMICMTGYFQDIYSLGIISGSNISSNSIYSDKFLGNHLNVEYEKCEMLTGTNISCINITGTKAVFTDITGNIGSFISMNNNNDILIFTTPAAQRTYTFYDYGTSANILMASQVKISPEGGYLFPLINDSGIISEKGTVISMSTGSIDSAYNITAANGINPIGVVYESGIMNGEKCLCVLNGIAQVLLQNDTATSRGNWASMSTDRGRITNTPTKSSISFQQQVGFCMQETVSGTDVLTLIKLQFV